MRPDLQALTPDDLASIGNRGLLKKATKEIDSGDLEAEWEEGGDGTIKAAWSDGVVCILPGDKTVSEAECDCAATGMCRHIIRTVLAWQNRGDTPGEEKTGAIRWDPGSISDEALSDQVEKSVMTQANKLWNEGILAEVIRSAKPSVRFYSPGHTIRFPVPNDLRYGMCSCPDAAPCVHAVLAVRAFRLLEAEKDTGIVYQGTADAKVNPEPLVEGANAFGDLIKEGFGGVTSAWRDKVLRIANDCQKAGYIWPGVILEEVADSFDRYHDRDAAFSPVRSLRDIGEYLVRSDAIQSGIAPVPQAFIRGTKTDRDISLGSARFVGLGGVAVETRATTEITVFLQENNSGHAVTVTRVSRENPDSDEDAKPFHALARLTAVRDATMALLARGQLVSQGGKRKASGKLIIGRARASVNPQNYTWEKLKAPVLVDDIDEILARLSVLPPVCFRPRSTSGDFHVCPIEKVIDARFDPSSNAVTAVLEDKAGHPFELHQPWTARNRWGADHLLARLGSSDHKPLFVAGNVVPMNPSLCFHPSAMVFETKEGQREAVMPWLDEPKENEKISARKSFASNTIIPSPYDDAEHLACEILLNGLRRLSRRDSGVFAQLATDYEARGYHRISEVISEVGKSANNPEPILVLFRMLTLARESLS